MSMLVMEGINKRYVPKMLAAQRHRSNRILTKVIADLNTAILQK